MSRFSGAGGFAFDERMDLVSICEDHSSTAMTGGSTPTMGSYKVKSSSSIAREAQKEMKKMQSLLEKVGSGTATRREEARLKSLNAKLSRMREEVEKSTRNDEVDALRRESSHKARSLLISFKKKEVRRVIDSVCAAESVDLAFIIDCTGSMQTYIESVKTNIKGIVRQVNSTNGNLKIRLAVVAYRDLCDGAKRFEVQDFQSSIDVFEEFVGNLVADGGGDTPEDMAGAIQKANSLSWRNPTRLAFLIADAPCHGTEYHGGWYRMHDNYPSGTPGVRIEEELLILLNQRAPRGTMSIHFGRITSQTDAMIHRFKSGYGIDLEVVSIEDAAKLKSTVTSSVRRSIFKTMTIAGADKALVSFAPPTDVHSLMETVSGRSRRAALRKFCLDTRVPSTSEWRCSPALKVKVYRNKKINSFSDLRLPIGFGILQNFMARMTARTAKTTHATMFMRRAPNPFAQGEIRIAFHGQLACQASELDFAKNSMVMKMFKHVGKGVNDREQYLKQMEVSNIAHFLAEKYNASAARPTHCASIHFLPVCLVEEEASTREQLGERRFCVEPPLPEGTFTKYSNNTGYWADESLDETLLRFTEWTFTVTHGYLMVTDLQGVKCGNKYYLTDPVILCKDIIRFGNTNLGEQFMKKCIDATRSCLKENGW